MFNVKTIPFIFCLFLSLLLSAQTSYRNRVSINDNWKFSITDSINYYTDSNFDDSKWETINLPHDWSIKSKFSKDYSGRNAWLPGGIAWYRKTIFIDKKDENKEFKIEFDGVYKNASLWVNEHYVGTQHDGYTSFYYNITPFLKFGAKNKIALKVNNSKQPNCRWYSGSGIYRNVWLTKTNKLSIDQWGTFVKTPKVTNDIAEVVIETSVRNYTEAQDIVLETTIYNNKGERVGVVTSTQFVSRKTTQKVNQSIEIKKPKLWSLDTSDLYTAKTVIKVLDEIVDEYHTTFGIRTIEFNAKNGFFLNGENLKMKGVCLHHDAGTFGAAVPIQIWERRLEKLKDIGCNAIRTAHTPMTPEFLDLCDQMGFLVMNEFVDKWNGNDALTHKNAANATFYNPSKFSDPYFEFEWKKNYTQTIKRDRNHPSVIIWSVGNENNPPGSPEQIAGLKKYTALVRELDATRPVISGMERSLDDVPAKKVKDIIETCKEMDLIALNYGEQWCKAIGAENPGKPYISTESYTYFNSSPEKRFANVERAPWLDVLDNTFNMGLFLWVGIDYLGESRRWPKIGSSSGLLNRASFKNEIASLYEAFWLKKPVVCIAVYEKDADDFTGLRGWGAPTVSKKWNFKKGKKLDIVTYTNCESVDLYLNGKKIGNKKRADFNNWIMKWRSIGYEAGTLKAVGLIKGKPVCEFLLSTTTKLHHLDFSAYKPTFSDTSILQIEIAVKDEKGLLITDKEVALSFKLEGGSSKIIGLDNGDVYDRSSFNNIKTCIVKKGKCLVVIQKNGVTNEKLVVTNKNLKKQIYRF